MQFMLSPIPMLPHFVLTCSLEIEKLGRLKVQEDHPKLRIASLLFPHPPSLGLSCRLALGVPAQPLTPLHSPRSRSRCTLLIT